jgi:redox-sensitive bicupin YhaK (pirin superfamily)
MITLRRANERHRDRRPDRDAWLTFFPQDRLSPLASGFGALQAFDEDRLAPGASVLAHGPGAAEIITYVRAGALAHDDPAGSPGVIQAGEFQRTTVGPGSRHADKNASATGWAHAFQIWLRPARIDWSPGREQKRFSAAERRGVLCAVASPDGRAGSLRLHQDAFVHSAILGPGTHVVHGLGEGRIAWVHLVAGEITLGDVVLSTGDGAGVTAERSLSLTAREETEILLVDLGVEGGAIR